MEDDGRAMPGRFSLAAPPKAYAEAPAAASESFAGSVIGNEQRSPWQTKAAPDGGAAAAAARAGWVGGRLSVLLARSTVRSRKDSCRAASANSSARAPTATISRWRRRRSSAESSVV